MTTILVIVAALLGIAIGASIVPAMGHRRRRSRELEAFAEFDRRQPDQWE